MAVLFLDSFSHYDSSMIGRKWNFTGSPTIVTADRGAPFGAMQFNGSADAVFKTFVPVNNPTAGVGIKVLALPLGSNNVLIAWSHNGTPQTCLTLSSTGALSTRTGGAAGAVIGTSAAGVITAGAYHYVESQPLAGAVFGTHTVNVDGVQVIAPTLSNTQPDPSGTYNELFFGTDAAGAGGWSTWQMGDFYALDTLGTVNTTFLGPVVVEALRVGGPGADADWQIAGTVPALTNWDSVDEVPPDDLVTIVQSHTVGDTDTYQVDTPSITPSQVLCVQPVYCCQSATPGLSTFAVAVNNGVSGTTTDTLFPNSSFTFVPSVLNFDPFTSLPWANDPSLYLWGQQLLS